MSVIEDVASFTDEQLRARVVAWLHDNLPAEWIEAVERGDDDGIREARKLVDYADFCARLGEAGWATPTWPREYGFLGLTGGQARIVNEELNRYRAHRSFNIIGIGMGGPTIIQWGSEEQKHRYLMPMA